MRYIYSRVSCSDQHIEQQSKYLADRYNHDVIVEDVFTGKTTNRPKFQELLNKLESGDTLIVYHVSRLGRKTSEVLETVEALQARGVAVLVDQLQGSDITTGVGKMLFTMLAGLAEMEREQMLERQRIGIERAKAEGKYKGRKCVDRSIIESARVLLAAGKTKKSVAKQLNIGEATLYRYLKKS